MSLWHRLDRGRHLRNAPRYILHQDGGTVDGVAREVMAPLWALTAQRNRIGRQRKTKSVRCCCGTSLGLECRPSKVPSFRWRRDTGGRNVPYSSVNSDHPVVASVEACRVLWVVERGLWLIIFLIHPLPILLSYFPGESEKDHSNTIAKHDRLVVIHLC